MTRRVLLIGGRAPELKTAQLLGMEVANIQLPGEFPKEQQKMSAETLLADYTDVERVLPVVGAWHSANPFEQVISFAEEGLLPAAIIRSRLGLGGTPAEVTSLLRDKAVMRSRLVSSDLATVPFAECGGLGDVREFACDNGYPVVVKPKDGVRSRCVYRVADDDDAAEAVAGILAGGYSEFLVESLIVGRELSAEAVSHGGVHRVVGITEAFTDEANFEVGHVTPARITESEATAVKDYVERFLDVVGVVDGPSHTQLFLTPDRGPVVIESHDRIGMDREHELVQRTYGHDLFSLAFTIPAGRGVLPDPLRWEPRTGTAVWFIHGSGARLESVGGVSDAESAPGVVRFAMAKEPRLVGRVLLPSDRMGYVVACGDDAAHALDRARSAAERVLLEYE